MPEPAPKAGTREWWQAEEQRLEQALDQAMADEAEQEREERWW